ncbi:hypothetical protein OQI_08930 [Streptomyces pharetrae CZA14]|uniref:Uncharacterized protein n=2 Tax=Streptomyces TaxID=1883 RepID=A0ABX3YP14_9ACTN|nr:hypothetical protein OQI_08930 [Streptomyces pharetrae CZA14]
MDGQLSEGVHVMQHHAASAWLMAAAEEPGGGNLLRILLIVMLVGCALTAWLLLRGYRRKDD